MSTLEEFGPYLLLKKLSEDSLGEAFRAGRVGGEGVEQVVLLRVFNGRNINGGHLWQEVQERTVIQDGLKSPNIGNGVGMGEVRSIPYVAYDYVSGKNLSDLLVAASTTQQPMPTDHALLIAERIALALTMAYETRFGNDRILHGFVVPHLIMVSSEGETRLLGFEVAPGLTRLAGGGAFSTSVTRYLAPEALSAGSAEKSDDVFSLGVILFELLTCQPLPPPTAEGYGPIVERAQVASEGSAIPPQIASLIARSLAPRSQRIADAVTWHKELSRLIVDGQFNATTFNLAFFMHNLFRDEIERETEEIEAEKTLEIPSAALVGATQKITPDVVAAATASAAAATASPPPSAPAATALPDVDLDAEPAEEESGGGKKGLWIGLAAAAALIALAAAGWLYWNRSPGGETIADVAPETAVAAQLPDPALE
ncbi:MAG: protein kinase, partial [Acidobacteriota bacterium]